MQIDRMNSEGLCFFQHANDLEIMMPLWRPSGLMLRLLFHCAPSMITLGHRRDEYFILKFARFDAKSAARSQVTQCVLGHWTPCMFFGRGSSSSADYLGTNTLIHQESDDHSLIILQDTELPSTGSRGRHDHKIHWVCTTSFPTGLMFQAPTGLSMLAYELIHQTIFCNLLFIERGFCH